MTLRLVPTQGARNGDSLDVKRLMSELLINLLKFHHFNFNFKISTSLCTEFLFFLNILLKAIL